MSVDLMVLLKDIFPDEAGIRNRCRLALGMGYNVIVAADWILTGQPYEKRAAWKAEHAPRLAELDRRLQG